uniref:Uncharacterized protein n=1 Tax=Opuntia streptacantha TaxID=393608 RepID=A0A7C9E8P2_OPUST
MIPNIIILLCPQSITIRLYFQTVRIETAIGFKAFTGFHYLFPPSCISCFPIRIRSLFSFSLQIVRTLLRLSGLLRFNKFWAFCSLRSRIGIRLPIYSLRTSLSDPHIASILSWKNRLSCI